MRKSEGNKRRIISPEQTRQIVEAYSAFEPTKTSLILDHRDFGYLRVKVLRPLRIKMLVSDEGFAKLAKDKTWSKLTDGQRGAWTNILTPQTGIEQEIAWLEPLVKSEAKKDGGLRKAAKALTKAFIAAFGVRDPGADLVTDDDGNVIPDDQLTDYENVPLDTAISVYLAAEVLPHAPDAYIDESYRDEHDGKVGMVGYEINFNRYFYQYQPPRDLPLIDADLKAVEEEIAAALVEVTE